MCSSSQAFLILHVPRGISSTAQNTSQRPQRSVHRSHATRQSFTHNSQTHQPRTNHTLGGRPILTSNISNDSIQSGISMSDFVQNRALCRTSFGGQHQRQQCATLPHPKLPAHAPTTPPLLHNVNQTCTLHGPTSQTTPRSNRCSNDGMQKGPRFT